MVASDAPGALSLHLVSWGLLSAVRCLGSLALVAQSSSGFEPTYREGGPPVPRLLADASAVPTTDGNSLREWTPSFL